MVLHGERSICFLSSSIPYLYFSFAGIFEWYYFGGELDCDSGHDVVGYFLSGEGVYDVCFASRSISYQDDYLMRDLLFWISLFSSSGYEYMNSCTINSNKSNIIIGKTHLISKGSS